MLGTERTISNERYGGKEPSKRWKAASLCSTLYLTGSQWSSDRKGVTWLFFNFAKNKLYNIYYAVDANPFHMLVRRIKKKAKGFQISHFHQAHSLHARAAVKKLKKARSYRTELHCSCGWSPRAHVHVVGMLRFLSLTWTILACPLLFIPFLCLFLSLWPFQRYFIHKFSRQLPAFSLCFFRSYFCLVGLFNYIFLHESLPQACYNLMWLTGLKAPTNQLTLAAVVVLPQVRQPKFPSRDNRNRVRFQQTTLQKWSIHIQTACLCSKGSHAYWSQFSHNTTQFIPICNWFWCKRRQTFNLETKPGIFILSCT